jgi:hypothetical protein
VSGATLCGLRDAVAANRDLRRPMSRQVLYTHGPTPEGRPPLTALMDQWLSPFRYSGPCSTRVQADALRPLAASLLGEPSVLFQDLLLVKREGQKRFPWHQDFGFWPVDKPWGVVIWVPLQAWSCVFLSPRAHWSHANAPNHPLCTRICDGAPVTEIIDA